MQEYFQNKDSEEIQKYGHTIPNSEVLEMFSEAMFNKPPKISAGFDRVVHKHYYKNNLSEDELKEINEEYRALLNSGVLSKTKSGKATKVSQKIIDYKCECDERELCEEENER